MNIFLSFTKEMIFLVKMAILTLQSAGMLTLGKNSDK